MWRWMTAAVLLLLTTGNAVEAWTRPKVTTPAKLQACDGMGAGFVRLEGSDTCVRLSGSVRVEVSRGGSGAETSR